MSSQKLERGGYELYVRFILSMEKCKVFHRCRDHGEKGDLYVIVSMGEHGRSFREKGKYLVNTWTIACRLKNFT